MRFSKSYVIKKGVVLFLLLVLFCVFTVNFKIVIVNGHSMEPTYKDKQFILASRKIREIEKDDIVVFSISDDENIIKRVVAQPGDVVSIKNNELYVNGCKLVRTKCYTNDTEIVIKENEYYVLGDNRLASTDSREFGAVKKSQIKYIIK